MNFGLINLEIKNELFLKKRVMIAKKYFDNKTARNDFDTRTKYKKIMFNYLSTKGFKTLEREVSENEE